MTEHEFLKVSETAKVLRVTEQAVYRMIRAGELGSTRLGGAIRVPRRAIDALIDASLQTPEPAVPETAAIS